METLNHHAERALEAIRLAAPILSGSALRFPEATGLMLDALAYYHSRGAARAALNLQRKVKK